MVIWHKKEGKKKGNVSFNDALNTYGVGRNEGNCFLIFIWRQKE